MRKVEQRLSDYTAYHKKSLTRLTHYFGIPLVMMSIFILCSWVIVSMEGVFSLSLSSLIVCVGLLNFLRLDAKLALWAAAWIILLLWICFYIAGNAPNWLAFYWFVGTFIAGWSLQILGHVIEGKKPALLDNLSQAAIAPLYITAELAVSLGQRDDLKHCF